MEKPKIDISSLQRFKPSKFEGVKFNGIEPPTTVDLKSGIRNDLKLLFEVLNRIFDDKEIVYDIYEKARLKVI